MKVPVISEDARKPAKKNLTVRLDPDLRMTLEAIAESELRTLANQITVFLRQGITEYKKTHKVKFAYSSDGNKLEVRPDK